MADKEKLSALMDGELVDKALIVELENDQNGLEAWKNYHLIGDVLRGEAPQKPEWNIAESVALALENEPAHNVFTANNVSDINEARIESQPAPHQAKRHLPTWITQFGQVGIAACVSLAVILGVQQFGGEATSETDQLPVLQTIPFSGSVEPVSLTRDSIDTSSKNDINVQEQRRRINAMLQDYELQLRLNSESAMERNDNPDTVVE
ncbi:sigma-E factor negative regulatory protein [Vibrio renipiscarius]|uniref:Anti-sigma-E factor RseA n=1 Tax=Vibrio renipiscarius TaxID=1461322 RepID=A0A0C2KD06_9VIBR|nr:sigma-E factor negative regulatory protein [Vibrio renipiscarius]KII79983.1 anti-sigma E factor [Vibrio renipiscarius]KII80044.1 anti-sigma E factor [Vibrio renipiscarius]